MEETRYLESLEDDSGYSEVESDGEPPSLVDSDSEDEQCDEPSITKEQAEDAKKAIRKIDGVEEHSCDCVACGLIAWEARTTTDLLTEMSGPSLFAMTTPYASNPCCSRVVSARPAVGCGAAMPSHMTGCGWGGAILGAAEANGRRGGGEGRGAAGH